MNNKQGDDFMSIYSYIRASGVRKLTKENGKHCGKDFLQALDRMLYQIILRACKFNGGNKRLSAAVIE